MEPIPDSILMRINALLDETSVPSTHCVSSNTIKELKSPLDF